VESIRDKIREVIVFDLLTGGYAGQWAIGVPGSVLINMQMIKNPNRIAAYREIAAGLLKTEVANRGIDEAETFKPISPRGYNPPEWAKQ
jgi:hypothetical protein